VKKKKRKKTDGTVEAARIQAAGTVNAAWIGFLGMIIAALIYQHRVQPTPTPSIVIEQIQIVNQQFNHSETPQFLELPPQDPPYRPAPPAATAPADQQTPPFWPSGRKSQQKSENKGHARI
jgi:hypothetical protein